MEHGAWGKIADCGLRISDFGFREGARVERGDTRRKKTKFFPCAVSLEPCATLNPATDCLKSLLEDQ